MPTLVGKKVFWTKQAQTDVRGIEQDSALHVLKTLARYAENGVGDVKALQGFDPPLYRRRAQEYRVLFRFKGDTLEITRVRARKDAYR